MMSDAIDFAGDGDLRDPVEDDRLRDLVDVVEDVVEPGGQRVDVLALEGRDERAVEQLDDLVGELIAGMLEVLDRRLVRGHRADVVERAAERDGRRQHGLGLLVEQLVEATLAAQQGDRHGRGDPNGKA